MAQAVKITKLSISTSKGVCKAGFCFEYLDEFNRRHSGTGRFASVEGSAENWPGLIKHDLERRMGRAVDIQMPPVYGKYNPKWQKNAHGA